MVGHRLVHRVVQDFGRQVMEGIDVGAADIHARTAADRLKPLQHLDVLGGIGLGGGGWSVKQVACIFGHGNWR